MFIPVTDSLCVGGVLSFGEEWTALMCAAARARPDYVEILVENGADVNKVNNDIPNETALRAAVVYGDRGRFAHTREESFISDVRAVVEFLLDRGANVNARGWRGQTVLHRAVVWGVMEVVQLLVDRGADLQVRDRMGETPHDIAVEYSRSPETLALLVPPAAAD